MYKLKSESDNTVVEEVNKKLVKEYHDFFVEILQRWKVIMDMVGVDKPVEEVKMKLTCVLKPFFCDKKKQRNCIRGSFKDVLLILKTLTFKSGTSVRKSYRTFHT